MGDFLANPVVPRTEPTRPFEAGDLIADRFRVVRQVGEGGMAMVYEAIDEKLGERRALKCQRQMPRPEIVNVCTPTSRQSAPPRRPDPQQVANSPGEVTVGGTVVPAINQIGWLG